MKRILGSFVGLALCVGFFGFSYFAFKTVEARDTRVLRVELKQAQQKAKQMEELRQQVAAAEKKLEEAGEVLDCEEENENVAVEESNNAGD